MGRSGTMKLPDELVSAFRAWPVPAFVTVTLAPGITDPDGSEMVPVMVAVSCPNSRAAPNNEEHRQNKTRVRKRYIVPPLLPRKKPGSGLTISNYESACNHGNT